MEALHGCCVRSLGNLTDPLLEPSLHLLRNLCAANAETQTRVLTPAFVSVLEVLAGRLWKGDHAEGHQAALHRLLQLLGNGVAGNAATQAHVWAHFYPAPLLALLGRPAAATHSLAAFVLHALAAHCRPRLASLASGEGALLLGEVVARTALALHPSHPSHTPLPDLVHVEWGRLVLRQVCLHGLLPEAHAAVGTDLGTGLLWLVDQELGSAGAVATHDVALGYPLPGPTARWLAHHVAEALGPTVALWGSATATGQHLQDTWLPLLNTVASLPSTPAGLAPVLVSQSSLLQAAIRQLRRGWETVPIVKPRANVPPSAQASHWAQLKLELVRLIGNLCHCNVEAQDITREEGGIVLLLNHCQLDVHGPIIREWYVSPVLCSGVPDTTGAH